MPGPNYAGIQTSDEVAVSVIKDNVVNDETPQTAKHVGGGWYELSDGSRVQGKADAEEAQAKL